MSSFKKLDVWKNSISLVKYIYLVTSNFLQTEIYTLTSQMRRAEISILSNIAERYSRTTVEFARFISISHGSCSELKTQIIIAKEIGFLKDKEYENLIYETNKIPKMLKSLERKIRGKINDQ